VRLTPNGDPAGKPTHLIFACRFVSALHSPCSSAACWARQIVINDVPTSCHVAMCDLGLAYKEWMDPRTPAFPITVPRHAPASAEAHTCHPVLAVRVIGHEDPLPLAKNRSPPVVGFTEESRTASWPLGLGPTPSHSRSARPVRVDMTKLTSNAHCRVIALGGAVRANCYRRGLRTLRDGDRTGQVAVLTLRAGYRWGRSPRVRRCAGVHHRPVATVSPPNSTAGLASRRSVRWSPSPPWVREFDLRAIEAMLQAKDARE
jgi:hypothetical protein